MQSKIIIFDLGGVLINLNVSQCMRAFEGLMGEEKMRLILGMDSQGEGVKAVSVASKQLMVDFERGLISTDTFITEVLGFCKTGTTRQDVADAWMAMLGDLPAERLDYIDQLRAKGYKTFLLSNGNDLHFDFINRTYGLDAHFDGLFLSQAMHMAKPEEQIFQAVQQAIQPFIADAENKDIIYIDDLEINRRAAEQYVHWTTFASIGEAKATLNP